MSKTKSLFSVVAIILVFAIFCSSVFADYNATVYTYYTDTVTLPSNHGGRNVRIHVYNNSEGFVNDVRMLGWNGGTVWEEYGAIDAGATRTFWCGSDVAKIQVKVRKVSSSSYEFATCSCNVIFL